MNLFIPHSLPTTLFLPVYPSFSLSFLPPSLPPFFLLLSFLLSLYLFFRLFLTSLVSFRTFHNYSSPGFLNFIIPVISPVVSLHIIISPYYTSEPVSTGHGSWIIEIEKPAPTVSLGLTLGKNRT